MFIFVLSATAVAAEPPPPYSILLMEDQDGYALSAQAISEHGAAVGMYVHQTGVDRAFRWDSSGMFLFDLTPDSVVSEALGINDSGASCGYDNRQFFRFRAATWSETGQVRILTGLGGDNSWAFDLNNRDEVVGWSELSPGSGDRRAVLWRDGIPIDLGDLGFPHSEAYAANDLSQVAGMSWLPSRYLRAFIWEDGVMTDLGTLGGNSSVATDINELGWVAGTSQSPTETFGVVWIDGLPQVLEGRGASPSGLNNLGDVVGSCLSVVESRQLSIWIDQSVYELRDLVAPNHRWDFADPAWSFVEDINDNRQIVGWMRRSGLSSSITAGFLMSPVTWTASLELVGGSPGVAGGINTLTADGFTPGARVYFVYSRHGGGAMIPGCSLLDNALQIDDPKIAGRATADANGVAELTAFVPAAAASLGEIVIQAVDPDACAISNWIAVRFE
ncbi:MAG: hypothetical protein ACF8PN_08355 [Phycisphaerales bacterium]